MEAKQPMHGKTSYVRHNKHFLFRNLPHEFEVMRYHSLILDQVDKTGLQIIATSNNEVMAVAHSVLPIAGVQFHPESILTPNGLQIMKNWFDSVH